MLLKILQLELIMMLLILAGVYMTRTGRISREGRESLTNIVLDLILPCNIFMSFIGQEKAETLRDAVQIIALSIFTIILSILSSRFFFRRFKEETRRIAEFGMLNSNSMFLGMPVVQNLFGPYAAVLHSLYMIFIRGTMWSYGISLFVKDGPDMAGTVKRVLKNPCMIAVEAGILFMIFEIPVPETLQRTMNYLNACLMAMSMLLIGNVLSDMRFENIFRKEVWIFNALRLVVIPLLTLGVCVLAGVSYMAAAVCVILTSMPSASLTAVLAAKYHADERYAGLIVTTSTILSILTIPVWGMAVQSIYGM